MAILDNLVEKKDLLAYINFRIKELRLNYTDIKDLPKSEREFFRRNHKSRIKELVYLRGIVNKNKIKSESIMKATYVKTQMRLNKSMRVDGE